MRFQGGENVRSGSRPDGRRRRATEGRARETESGHAGLLEARVGQEEVESVAQRIARPARFGVQLHAGLAGGETLGRLSRPRRRAAQVVGVVARATDVAGHWFEAAVHVHRRLRPRRPIARPDQLGGRLGSAESAEQRVAAARRRPHGRPGDGPS